MKLAIGADHAAFPLKSTLIKCALDLGWQIIDVGCNSSASCDYPDFAAKVALAVADKKAERGLMLCGSGVGAVIACNKIKGIRAGLCHDLYSAQQGVEHDDMNVLVVGAKIVDVSLAKDLLKAFLAATFSKEERHVRRLAKIAFLEDNFGNEEKIYEKFAAETE